MDIQTKLSLCGALLRCRHKNQKGAFLSTYNDEDEASGSTVVVLILWCKENNNESVVFFVIFCAAME